MATASERVSVLMTPSEKKRLVNRARKTGISVGEFLRRAANGYREDGDNEQAIETMIEQMNRATLHAEQAIDDALQFVAESNRRIADMETEAKGDKA